MINLPILGKDGMIELAKTKIMKGDNTKTPEDIVRINGQIQIS